MLTRYMIKLIHVPIIVHEGTSQVLFAVQCMTGFVVLYPVLHVTLADDPYVVLDEFITPFVMVGTEPQSKIDEHKRSHHVLKAPKSKEK